MKLYGKDFIKFKKKNVEQLKAFIFKFYYICLIALAKIVTQDFEKIIIIIKLSQHSFCEYN